MILLLLTKIGIFGAGAAAPLPPPQNRVTEAGDNRVTESGDNRVTEGS